MKMFTVKDISRCCDYWVFFFIMLLQLYVSLYSKEVLKINFLKKFNDTENFHNLVEKK